MGYTKLKHIDHLNLLRSLGLEEIPENEQTDGWVDYTKTFYPTEFFWDIWKVNKKQMKKNIVLEKIYVAGIFYPKWAVTLKGDVNE